MLSSRSDGRLIKSLNSFSRIVPFILENRTGSMNQISVKIDLENTLAYLKKHKDISIFHILLAAIVRTFTAALDKQVCRRPQNICKKFNRYFFYGKKQLTTIPTKPSQNKLFTQRYLI